MLMLTTHNTTSAQDSLVKKNSILISPFALVTGNYNKIRIRVQRSIKNHFILGTDLKYYFPKVYPGYQISPFLKFFLRDNVSNGIYFYANGIYGNNKNLPDDRSKYYSCYGGGLGVGLQIRFGKTQTGLLDFALGLKSVTTNANLSIRNTPEGYTDYYIVGPASIFDGILAIGISF